MSESSHPEFAVFESLSKSLQSLIALSSPPDAEQVTRVALGRAFRELWSGLDGLAHSQNPPWRRLYGPHDPLVSVPWGSFPSWCDAAESLIENAARRLRLCGYPAAADVVPSKEAVAAGVELMQELLSGGTTLNELILRVERERDALQRLRGAEAAGTPVQVEIKPESRPKRRGAGGRPRVSKDEARWRQQVLRDWIEAKSAGVDLKTFANQYSAAHPNAIKRFGKLSVLTMRKLEAWSAMRQRRKREAE